MALLDHRKKKKKQVQQATNSMLSHFVGSGSSSDLSLQRLEGVIGKPLWAVSGLGFACSSFTPCSRHWAVHAHLVQIITFKGTFNSFIICWKVNTIHPTHFNIGIDNILESPNPDISCKYRRQVAFNCLTLLFPVRQAGYIMGTERSRWLGGEVIGFLCRTTDSTSGQPCKSSRWRLIEGFDPAWWHPVGSYRHQVLHQAWLQRHRLTQAHAKSLT